jgi:hypothetical protein
MCPPETDSDNVFLREKNGNLYYVVRSGKGNGRKESWYRIKDSEKDLIEQILKGKKQILDEIVEFPCMNPDCRNKIKMTRVQLEEFFISYKKKYDMVVFPCCSKECRDKLLEKHGGKLICRNIKDH